MDPNVPYGKLNESGDDQRQIKSINVEAYKRRWSVSSNKLLMLIAGGTETGYPQGCPISSRQAKS